MKRIKKFVYFIKFQIIIFFSEAYIESKYGGFWEFKKSIKNTDTPPALYYAYQRKFNAFIGIHSQFEGNPITPHGLNGIHVSDRAHIGKDCIIFQYVTIGSNTIIGHKRYGSPVIGDNVLIGAGAKIIGNVRIGNNCRIGANCVVVSDMPDNTTAVLSPPRFISKSAAEMINIYKGINND